MTKVFLIAITMFWADAMDTPLQDSVEIKWLDGQPLYFMSVEECGKLVTIVKFKRRLYYGNIFGNNNCNATCRNRNHRTNFCMCIKLCIKKLK